MWARRQRAWFDNEGRDRWAGKGSTGPWRRHWHYKQDGVADGGVRCLSWRWDLSSESVVVPWRACRAEAGAAQPRHCVQFVENIYLIDVGEWVWAWRLSCRAVSRDVGGGRGGTPWAKKTTPVVLAGCRRAVTLVSLRVYSTLSV